MSFASCLTIAAIVVAEHFLPLPAIPDPTLHVFRESTDGGVQQVIANTSASTKFIAHMRHQLRDEISSLERGEFPDPVAPGKTPAVVALRSAGGHVVVTYRDIPRGGELHYVSHDPKVVAALHDWMAATVKIERGRSPGGPGNGEGE